MKLIPNITHPLFTSESVAPGHPDKICDQIADAIFDAFLKQDPHAKVACEVFITTNFVLIGGEVHSHAQVDYQVIARKVITEIGYINDEIGFNGFTCEIKVLIHEQSPDILQGVELKNHQIGAGDQGIMFGYACQQTSEYMPLAIVLAHELIKRATKLRKEKKFKYALLDMKAQVSIDQEDPKNLKIHTILMSIQHQANYDEKQFKTFIHTEIMQYIANKYHLNLDFKYLINPTGKFVIGGPAGDTGLTGRKLMVDTYGGAACHGGGAFSGKDPTKVDRTGAYYARYIAKNIVAANLAKICEVQLAYAIGTPEPIAIFVNTHQTIISGLTEAKLTEIIYQVFDCSASAMIDKLELLKQNYQQLSTYGHFGRNDLQLPWEKLDKVSLLKTYLPKK